MAAHLGDRARLRGADLGEGIGGYLIALGLLKTGSRRVRSLRKG